MQANPLMNRYLTSNLQFRRFGIAAIIYASLLMVTFTIAANAQAIEITLGFTAMGQVILFGIWPAFICSNIINNELANKSYDFFRMLPLSPRQKTWGILIGANISPLILGTINLLFLFMGAIATMSLINIVALYSLYIFGFMTFTHLGLLSSVLNPRLNKQVNSGIFILALLFFIMPFSFGLTTLAGEDEFLMPVNYYGILVPVVFISIMMMSAIIIWAHLSIIRKFEDERKPLFSRLRAILFYLTFFILTAGFFIPGEEEISAGIMAGISALIAAITMISSIENAPSFIERMSAKAHEKRTINYWYVLKNSNLCTCLLLVMLWLLSLSAVLLYSGDINGQTVLLLLSVTSGFILLSVISETATQLKPSANHIYYLAVTVAAIYLILPIILGEVIVVLSPLGGILFIIELTSYYGHDIKPEDIYVGSAVSIVSNLFFSGVVYHILHNKYVKNVNMIRQMLSN